MKIALSILIPVFLCAAAGASPFTETEAQIGIPILPGVSGERSQKLYNQVAGGDWKITYRELLGAYAGRSDEQAQFAAKLMNYQSGKLGASVVAGFEQLATEATKANDPRATIYRRAADKLALQAKESSVRQDAQSAVADALKAIAQN